MLLVTVPVFGFGIKPRGPRILPDQHDASYPELRWQCQNPETLSEYHSRSSLPTRSAPASCASLAKSPSANTTTRTVLPVPCGRETVPRTCWSAFFTSIPRLAISSMVSSNFAVAFFSLFPQLRQSVEMIFIQIFDQITISFSVINHYLSTSIPIERAVPAIMLAA